MLRNRFPHRGIQPLVNWSGGIMLAFVLMKKARALRRFVAKLIRHPRVVWHCGV